MAKKRNELSLWSFPYNTKYYLTHPHKWFYDFYWNIRNFWQRGKYGYAYVDVWNWYHWYAKVGAESLRYLAENGHGYPGYRPWETPEKWHDYLIGLADKLDWCNDSCEMDCHDEENEYANAYHSTKNFCREWDDLCKVYVTTTLDGANAQEIRDKYWTREEELTKQDDEKREQIFGEIGRNLPRFWD